MTKENGISSSQLCLLKVGGEFLILFKKIFFKSIVSFFQVTAPSEFQSVVVGGINKRNGLVLNTDTNSGWFNAECEVSLNDMFGYCKNVFFF